MMTLAASTSTVWVGWARDSWGYSPQQMGPMLAVVPVVMGLGWAVFMLVQFRRREGSPVPVTPAS
jgi:hypothetical protein